MTPNVRENPAANKKRMNAYETPFSVVMVNVLTRPPGVETSTSSAIPARAGGHDHCFAATPPVSCKNDIPISVFDKCARGFLAGVGMT
jgi:hypothetical protein